MYPFLLSFTLFFFHSIIFLKAVNAKSITTLFMRKILFNIIKTLLYDPFSISYIYFNTDNDIWSYAVYTGPDPKAFENSLH